MAGNLLNVIKPQPSAHSDLGLTALAELGAEPFLLCPGLGPLSPQLCRSFISRILAHCGSSVNGSFLMGRWKKMAHRGQKEASSTWAK